jgi:hypothetical protein
MNMNATAQMVTVSQGGKPREDLSGVSQRGEQTPDAPTQPATGEWTVYSVMKLRSEHWHEEDKNNAIAIVHNAALAAAVEFYVKEREQALAVTAGALQQLAAEREGRKQDNLEWTKTVSDMSSAHDDDRLEAANQLAALADALHFYRNHDDNGQTATDALRKIGK